MHPAYSVIVFTCASGAGYGLLFWLALSAFAGGGMSRPGDIGLVGFGLSFLLITVGLLSSTAHLGRPERAWRAFSQWRTSWLSREGVVAMVTYFVGGLLALDWLTGAGANSFWFRVLGILSAVSALATVYCTGMIYQSLTTIRAWHHRLVAPIYVLLALMTGRLLLNAILATLTGYVSTRAIWLMLVLLVAGWITKATYWSAIDNERRTHTIGDATGLGNMGRVRTLDPPHTQANFVMREMGFEVARKHADRLRQIATVLLFVLPAILTSLILVAGSTLSAVLATVAVLSAAAGVGVERWLFFAEAEHVSMLYYGREAA
ncbi:MAG: DmsC/YnfH family molybdoenzyme membrane anchor subunit [Hyphomicrobiaceae bacterium]